MGRTPKPTKIKVLEGNPGQRPLNDKEPQPVPQAPECPEWLTGEGKRMWDKLAPQLENLGLLTEIDGEAFAAACQAWNDYVESIKTIKEKGRTYKYKNQGGFENETERPEVKVANKAIEQFRTFCREFGLTPASRTRIKIDMPESKEADPMEELVKGRGS